ncbi:MAG: hypothetical protein NTY48_00125 [Candidatus Diapherotrites archaeon]|nr:hypothetical protein [Candidatus Diapherotrites archaeon]
MEKQSELEEVLADIGLSSSEIKVYFALLELGSETTGPIVKRAGIASGKAYLVLDKLLKKGLATYILKGNIKYFHANEPENLLNYLKEKEDELKAKEDKFKAVLPQLKAKFEETKYKTRAEIFEGPRGVKAVTNIALKETPAGGTICIMGVPREANAKNEAFLLEWNKRRIAKGVKMKVLYSQEAVEFGRKREKMALTEVKYMPKGIETPSWIDVFEDYVIILNTRENSICFLIKDKTTAESYKKQFDYLWKQSSK